jgi:AmpD protein
MEVIQRHLSDGFNDYEIKPEGLLVHYVSARYTMPDDPYNVDEIIRILAEYGLGYHDLLPREGGVIELVPAPLRAWHAGESVWKGRTDCNSWMLGVALIGMHGEPFTDRQYDDLAQRTARHVARFPIRRENVAGHEDVAPDRKKDPGPSFDWDRYESSIAGLWRP